MRAITTLRQHLAAILAEEGLKLPEKTVIEPPREAKHGDLSTNAAMLLAKEARTNPRELAQKLAQALPGHCADIIAAEAAGPGFCNVTFSQDFWRSTVLEVEQQGAEYGNSLFGEPYRVLLEYVSANPTGPLHVGHGRGAAVGDSLARLLRRTGHEVDTEYYINDAGRQMRLLGLSVWLRLRELANLPVVFPEEYYKGDYIIDIARELLERDPRITSLPDAQAEDICYEYAMKSILDGIKADLAEFRVEHRQWFSEKSLVERGAVKDAFDTLTSAGHTYDKDGAFFFATEKFGDDKDRVLRKSDGSLTYFASDIAYHHDKFARGYNKLIDIWGADHHGYVPRVRAAIQALGKSPESLDVVLIQLVNLLRNGKPFSMSTRAGVFDTLADVMHDVGVDAARFMFLSRKSDSPLDFDLEVAKQRSMDNPVYYVQYGHARVCAVLRRARERGIELPVKCSADMLTPLDTAEDMALLRKLAGFGDMLINASCQLAVHHVSHYLTELAGLLHSYYAKHQILLADDQPRTLARLALLRAVAQTLRNGLDVLGVSAPENM